MMNITKAVLILLTGMMSKYAIASKITYTLQFQQINDAPAAKVIAGCFLNWTHPLENSNYDWLTQFSLRPYNYNPGGQDDTNSFVLVLPVSNESNNYIKYVSTTCMLIDHSHSELAKYNTGIVNCGYEKNSIEDVTKRTKPLEDASFGIYFTYSTNTTSVFEHLINFSIENQSGNYILKIKDLEGSPSKENSMLVKDIKHYYPYFDCNKNDPDCITNNLPIISCN